MEYMSKMSDLLKIFTLGKYEGLEITVNNFFFEPLLPVDLYRIIIQRSEIQF